MRLQIEHNYSFKFSLNVRFSIHICIVQKYNLGAKRVRL